MICNDNKHSNHRNTQKKNPNFCQITTTAYLKRARQPA